MLLILFSANHFYASFDVCFGSLSYWKIMFLEWTFLSSRETRNDLERMKVYWCASLFPSTWWSRPGLFQKMHPHTIRLPLLCFTTFHTFLSRNSLPGLLQQYCFPSDPNRLNFFSSEYHTLCQKNSCLWWWEITHIFCLEICFLDSHSFFLCIQPGIPFHINI